MISIVKQSDSPNKKNSANFTGVDKDIQTYERDLLDTHGNEWIENFLK